MFLLKKKNNKCGFLLASEESEALSLVQVEFWRVPWQQEARGSSALWWWLVSGSIPGLVA